MIKKSVMAALAGIAMLGATPVFAQGIGHTFFMRGSIVDTSASGGSVANSDTVSKIGLMYCQGQLR